MRVLISGRARRDLHEIYSYVEEQSPAAAENLARDINSKLENLARFPFIGRERSSLRSGMRSLVVGSYVLFYTVQPDQVTVYRVIDGRMDLDTELQR